MTRRYNLVLAALLGVWLAAAARAQAQEPIRFARTPDISPDGKLVAFSYLGDVWVVEAIGGVARPVTMHEKHDMMPVFSPDGRQLAFSSNRHGSYDVFVVPVQGGRPTRLTFDSADDFVTDWSPDGKYILFSSSRSTSFPFNYELFKVPVTGGRVQRVSKFEGREGVFSPAGDEIAYVRGPGAWYRRGYRGSSNDDIWIASADGSNNRQLTSFNGQDNSPMWERDGKALYYVSEYYGTPANIVRQELGSAKGAPLAVKSPPQQITHHTEDGVRRARLCANGKWIVYECGADLWVVSAEGGPPRKLAIEVHADDKTNPERIVTFTSGASEFAPSYDERFIAFVVHGSLFVMPRGGGKATRLTDGPFYNHSIAWSPDAKKIAFLSDRGGQEDVWLVESDDPAHKDDLVKAHKFKVKQLTNTPESESSLNFSPDGKHLTFLRAGKLVTMDPDGGNVKVVVDEGTVIDYEWSPDSKWVCYSRMDGSFASELYLIPATGATAANPARNITRYATFNAGVTWSKTGGKLAFMSERRGQTQSLFVLSLQKPAVAGISTPAAEIDWDDIHLRVAQPAPVPVLEGAINSDGTKVAFRSFQNGDDLWVASTNGRDMTRITTGNTRPTQIQWSRVMSNLVYFRDGSGQIHMVSAGMTSSAPVVPFKAKMTIRRDEEFAEMFEQSWRALRDNFYDPNFHGVNWKAVHEKYRPLIGHVAMKEDLYNLIYLMLGELNASHLGIRGAPNIPEEATADLGLIFDENYHGPGLRIAEVLKRGPADRRGINLKAGDIVVSIDRTDVTNQTNVARLLNGKVNESVLLEVVTPAMDAAIPADPKARRRVEIQAAKRSDISSLMYDRWVDHNAKQVAKLSGGKLGYIHIPSMDTAGLDRFVRALYSDNFDKEGIVLDVRYNGGGFTHDRVLNYLGGKEHTIFHQRNGGQGMVLRAGDRKWTKPLVLLVNNRSYSDAEIFPSAFRTLGLGKLVGQPTGAHVIGTMAIRLVDGSEFRLPRTGVFTAKGVNMEKEGVVPDFIVDQPPDELARGIDPQLVKAVDVLREDVVAWKQARSGVARNPSGGGTPPPVVRPAPAPMPPPAPATKPGVEPAGR